MCKNGYFLNSNICSKCSENLNCKTCEYDGYNEYCTSCIEGFFLVEGSTLKDNVCKQCNVENCFYCYDENECAVCNDGFYANNFSCFKCLDNCQTCEEQESICTSCHSHYYLDDKTATCKKCADICIECTGPTEIDCITCIDGYYLSEYNNRCYKCNEACQTCIDSSTKNCPTCSKGYFSFHVEDSESSYDYCRKCETECTECSGLTNCSKCVEGYFLKNSFCHLCDEGCKECSDVGECKKCYENYVSTINGNYVICGPRIKDTFSKKNGDNTIYLINCKFNSYFDPNNGGAIYIHTSELLTTSNIIIDCEFVNCNAQYGGAIRLGSKYKSKTIISCCFFRSNYATCSYGAADLYGLNITIENCKFENNEVRSDKWTIEINTGALSIFSSNANLTNTNTKMQSTISSSYKYIYCQEGLYLYCDSNIDNCSFVNFYKYGSNYENTGTAIFCNKKLVIKSSLFNNNTHFGSSSSFGAAIQCLSNSTIINSKFINNTNTNDYGGAIYFSKNILNIELIMKNIDFYFFNKKA